LIAIEQKFTRAVRMNVDQTRGNLRARGKPVVRWAVARKNVAYASMLDGNAAVG
jgi:hypothetical protein